ncbi:glycoside hydrolase family 3 N-terminal domain-containing protein [Jiulongibacter sp. NS-SX5]|uniref:glycoside hydrolase family 3 N-terminal domain-containing protein n=1 Tax=Jiulongibacter sp. NS-SX5 TaxID=3463854 RepID=UPI00405A3A33
MQKRLRSNTYFPLLITGLFSLGFIALGMSDSGSFERAFSTDPEDEKVQKEWAWADSVLQTLTLKEKIGQLFMIPAYSNKNEAYYNSVENLIEDYHVGGVIFFQGDPDTQARLTNRYQTGRDVPLWVGIDAEWGLGMRLKNTMSFPKQITLGAISDDQLIEKMGYEIGLQCKRLGIHINFAPVADVNTNPENPVINYRSFGESQEKVAQKASAYARGLKRAGVIAVAKHFPGHGDTDVDSHVSLPVVAHGKNRLNEIELIPFKRLIDDGIDGVMTGHLFVPALEPASNTPATVSENIVTEFLKNDLGYDGLTFTDALNMRGITKGYDAGGADLAAYKAGNDVLLQTANLPAAFSKIHSAFTKGELDESDLNKRVHKILRAKYRVGLSEVKPVQLTNLVFDLNNDNSLSVKDQLFKKAVTIARVQPGIIPFIQLDTLSIGSVAVSGSKATFQNQLGTFAKVINYKMDVKPGSSKDWQYIVDQADVLDYMIVSVHDMNSRKSRNFGVSPSTIQMIRALSAKTKVIICTFGNPYGLQLFDEFPNVICGYEEEPEAYKAVAETLFGALSANGKLPVTASSVAKVNIGSTSANLGRLTEDFPENVGMSSRKLREIDGIINDAIQEKAFPGGQVLVARRGKVVYHKAYGTFRYDQDEPVTTETIYDLASLTKVSATLQAAMMLNERGLLDLNLRAADYLPELKGTNKANMRVGDILFHQAGLKSFQAFWTHTKTPSKAFSGHYYEFQPTEDNLQVADNLYIKPAIRDSVWQWLIDTDYTTRRNRDGSFRYLYSDLGLIMIQRIIEKVSGQPLNEFLEQNLYEPLGMTRTLFNPLDKFDKSEIAPTENDQIFRGRQIWGTVHDPNAALLGGVAGHAGLFSTAWDLAKLYQMNLQKGAYGGRRYLYPETVKHFSTNYTAKSHRGIGWNKPHPDADLSSIASNASPNTYGHTGFTGTVVWVDPDRQLIFIMLANRVYPRDNNRKLMQLEVRRRVHEVINAAIES